MKKVMLMMCLLASIAVACSSLGNPKKMACQKGCESSYEDCKKDKSKSAAGCEAKKLACNKGCDEL